MEQIKLFDDSFKNIIEDDVQFLQFVDADAKGKYLKNYGKVHE